ncbi:hypothetical protein [Methylobacterium nigriterrae]|uniref:hypothetical protein n=1 Tax=Methylobacterium nigriterrae TaxID=3127512 RepID=UPI003013314D
MSIAKRQLAASIRNAAHIAEGETLAAFVLDEATERGPNPFPQTSAGVVRHVWAARSFEFRALGIQSAGLPCLLTALAELPLSEPLVQEILRSGPYSLHAFTHGDGCRMIGAVLHSRPNVPLPPLVKPRNSRRGNRTASVESRAQLDLFASAAL